VKLTDKKMIFSPLDQFEIRVFFFLRVLNIDVSITNATVYLSLITFLVFLFFFFSVYDPRLIPTKWQLFTEFSYDFVFGIVKQQAGPQARNFFPLIATAFFFVLFANLIGLLPFAFTVTSHIVLTWTLAFSFNLAWFFLGLNLHGFKFFGLFVPSGLSSLFKPLLVAIVIIEIISYLIRSFSLSVRLFANMMAGHTLLQILSSFAVAFINSGFFIFALLPFVLVLAVCVLEFGIAIIQAYVFTILVSIYLKDSLQPSHLNFFQEINLGLVGIEPTSTAYQTAILPLNYKH
jgi:ATP synthase subunit 6